MKKLLLFIALAAFLTTCKRSTIQSNSLVGKWRLFEYLADPGDGSAKWQTADPFHPSYIEFKNDGTLIYTPSNQYDANHYQLTSDSTLIFITSANDNLRAYYRISGTTLTINPPCYEPCGERFVAVR
jgi:hypothetical protein